MVKNTNNNPAQQLPLFPARRVPARFRLDDATVQRGRRHIAAIRRQLAASAAAEPSEPHPPIPARHLDSPRAA